MKCEFCGSEIPDNVTSCAYCGAKVAPVASAQVQPAGPVGQAEASAPAASQVAASAPMGGQAAAPASMAGYPAVSAAPGPAAGVPSAQVEAPQPKRSYKPAIILAAAAVAVIALVAVIVGVMGSSGPARTASVPEDAVTAIRGASALADEMATRYTSYRDAVGAGEEAASEDVRTYEIALAEIQGSMDRVDAQMEALEAAGQDWTGHDQALAAMKNLRSTLDYELDILEAQHDAMEVAASSSTTALDAIATLYDNYSAIKPPDCMADYLSSTIDMLPTFYSALQYNNQASSSTLSLFTAEELRAWWMAKQAVYDMTSDDILVKQSQASRDMLDRLAEGQVVDGAPTVEADLIGTIAPNMYPSLDAAAVFGITSYDERSVTVEAEVVGFTQKYEQKFDLAQGYNYLTVKPALLPTGGMSNLGSNSTTQLNVKVTDVSTGEVLVQKSEQVNLLSMYDFTWYNDEFGATAAFDILAWLRPQAPEVNAVNRKAADVLDEWTKGGTKAILGYQYGTDVLATLMQVAAIQKAISDLGVVYIMDGYSFTSTQHVLTPDAVVNKRQGLCIETSLLMASCLMSANMHPLIILLPGHAQVAVETYAGSGNYFLIETTTLPYPGVDVGGDASTPAYYRGLLALENGKAWTLNGTSDEWATYLSSVSDGSDEFGGVFVIDCNLQRIMDIQGLENMTS